MIEYRGRDMPCFMRRQTHRGGCDQTATHRVEGATLLVHLCDVHTEEFLQLGGYVAHPLAAAGTLDTISADTLDPDTLLAESPHVESANGIRRVSETPSND